MTNDGLPPPSADHLIQQRVYQEIAKGRPVDVDRLATEIQKILTELTLQEIASSVAAKVAAANGTVVGSQAVKDRLRLEPLEEEERGKILQFPLKTPPAD